MGCGGVWKISLNNLICHKLGILSFLLTNYCQLLSGYCGRRHVFVGSCFGRKHFSSIENTDNLSAFFLLELT